MCMIKRVLDHSENVKNVHHIIFKLIILSNKHSKTQRLFICQMRDKEKEQILTFNKVEPENKYHFSQ